MVHRDGNPFEGVPLDADDHACVDFRFCADPKMRWWFDHHPTAFQPPALREIFEREHAPTWFFDPKAPSCAGLIARTLATGWKWQPPPHLVDAVAWADKIDAARFASAEGSDRARAPRRSGSPRGSRTAAPASTPRATSSGSRTNRSPRSLQRPELAPQIAAIEAERARELDAIRALAVWHGDVVVFDRFDDLGARNPGFLGYWLFPECALRGRRARARRRSIKITVGVNPWTTSPRKPTIDVGALCARFGGGGHAVVGGVTLRGDELERARTTIAQLVAELVPH